MPSEIPPQTPPHDSADGTGPLHIHDASGLDGRRLEVRIEGGRIVAAAERIEDDPRARTVDAAGGLLIPGLSDHHIHLYALAARAGSVSCGPPEVETAEGLARALALADARAGRGAWLRGVGYHESVAGEIDRDWLDAVVPQRPVRIQHRGGRLWILNSAALDALSETSPLERQGGRLSGRLYDGDRWLAEQLRGVLPDLSGIGRALAAHGITALTDTGPHNDARVLEDLRAQQADGRLRQRLCVMGSEALPRQDWNAGRTGALKIHLLESRLPDFDGCVDRITAAHGAGRNVAIHCVTRVELVFALQALAQAGAHIGDRIEHAAVAPPECITQMSGLGLTAVMQPGLVHTRGDSYLRDVDRDDLTYLHPLRSIASAGIPVAGSSDAPHGEPDPWRAMQAAVDRCTRAGARLNVDQAISPEQALRLYLSPLADPGGEPAGLGVGAAADLCLLDRDWACARRDLASVEVVLTMVDGRAIHARPGG